MPQEYKVIQDGNFLKVTHPKHGEVAFARFTPSTGRVYDIDFLQESFRKSCLNINFL